MNAYMDSMFRMKMIGISLQRTPHVPSAESVLVRCLQNGDTEAAVIVCRLNGWPEPELEHQAEVESEEKVA